VDFNLMLRTLHRETRLSNPEGTCRLPVES
jgi:hypothetical protein